MTEVDWVKPLQERVATAIAAAMAIDAPFKVRWQDCLPEARAAIIETLEGLRAIEIPVAACNAGLAAMSKGSGTVEPREFETVFREMVRVLLEELKGPQ